MEEEEARLALLQTELNNLQSNLRNMDSIILQIKGWCVTASLAIGGFAITSHKPALLLVGEVAIVGFFLINCQFRMAQRRTIERNWDIDSELKKVGVMQVLKGGGPLEIMGTSTKGRDHVAYVSIPERIRQRLPDFWFEICRVSTFSLYVFLAICLFAEFIILL